MPTKILMLGDSITAGVYGQLQGGPGVVRLAPEDWTLTVDWGIAQLIQDTQVRSNSRLASGEQYDVVVVSSGVGNAVAEVTGVLWNNQPCGLATLLPVTMDIAMAWISRGSTVILTAGPGVKPGFDSPEPQPAPSTPVNILASVQGMYLSHWANLVNSAHRPILSYMLPRHRLSYWAPGSDYVHLSYEGYGVCAKRLKREIERRVA